MFVLRRYRLCYYCIPHTGTRSLWQLFKTNTQHYDFIKVGRLHARELPMEFRGEKVPAEYRDYQAVACHRNPFDRLVGLYHFWGSKHKGRVRWEDFVRKIALKDCSGFPKGHPVVLSITEFLERVTVAEFLRFEHFEEDIRRVFFVSGQTKLPHVGNRTYRHMMPWSSKTIGWAIRWAEEDFDRFGYEKKPN